MPKKKRVEGPKEQFERFQKAVQDLIDAGELDPTEAEERFERAMANLLPHDREPTSSTSCDNTPPEEQDGDRS